MIHLVCPLRVLPIYLFYSASQIHTHPSLPPDARYLQSGLQAILKTQFECPPDRVAIGVSVCMSHNLIVVSPLAVANVSPVVLNATANTAYS